MKRRKRTDIFELHRVDYMAPPAPILVDIPEGKYVSIEGRCKLGSQEHLEGLCAMDAVGAIVRARYLKLDRDFENGPVEGLWWRDDGSEVGEVDRFAVWNSIMLRRMPDDLTPESVTRDAAALHGSGAPADTLRVSLRTLAEGRCVQMMYRGRIADMGPAVAAMRDFATSRGLSLHGPHHEVYLSNHPEEKGPVTILLRRIVR